MKKFLFILAAIFIATSILSCSKDEPENDKIDNTEVKLVRQIKKSVDYEHGIPSGLRTIDLEYDSQNRIVRYYEYYEDSFYWHNEWNFMYDGDSMIANFNDYGEESVYNCKLNKDGYITEWTDADKSKKKITYKNGYLVYCEYIYPGYDRNFKYNWEDGNITYILDNDSCDYFSYSPYKYPHINLDLFYVSDNGCVGYGDDEVLGLLGFFGRHNDYLPAVLYWDNGYIDYVYEFNEDGTVSKIIFGMVYMELYY